MNKSIYFLYKFPKKYDKNMGICLKNNFAAKPTKKFSHKKYIPTRFQAGACLAMCLKFQ